MSDRLAKWLYSKMERMAKKPDRILNNSAVYRDLQTLEPTGNTQKRQKEYVIKKLSLCSIILIVGVILSLAMWIKEGMDTEIVDNRLFRNAYGEGLQTVELVAENAEESFDISLEIQEKKYTDDELRNMLKQFLPLLEECVLGKNASFDKVEYDLNLVSSMDEFPFTVEWLTNEEYIDCDGRLVQDILENPQIVELAAEISCESFRAQHVLNCYIHTKAIQPDKSEQLTKQVKESEENNREQEFMTLPSEIDEEALNWSYKRSYNGLIFLATTPILAMVLYFGKDRDLHKQVEEREEQMCLDYPEIVSSLALLIGAGMTVPNAWNKVAKDYLVKKDQTKAKRYAYEEMLLTIHEMENGISQTKAYERFGRRCRISSYNKLATMLSQNVRKGSTNLAVLLREEAKDAFEERKHMARKLGEKAGTKLLVPMMLMLCMIMVVIMVPAFTTYF